MIELNKRTADILKEARNELHQDNCKAELEDNQEYFIDERDRVFKDSGDAKDYILENEEYTEDFIMDDQLSDWCPEGEYKTGKEIKDSNEDHQYMW